MGRNAISVAILATVLLAVVRGQQTSLYPKFPYCQCKKGSSSYSLAPVVNVVKNNTYCFKLQVRPPANCTSYCCSRADLRKIEFDVDPKCKVNAAFVRATVNGRYTPVAPSFDLAKNGIPGSTILRVTQLGLGLTDDGADICVTIASSKPNVGCASLTELCVPPPGEPDSVCQVALFDSSMDCCPISKVPIPPGTPIENSGVTPPPPSLPPPSPPPPSPPPPSPPPPSPPPPSPPPPSPPPPSPPPPSPPPPSPPPPSPPPPSPPPPSPPPPSPRPPPPPPPCVTCAYLVLEHVNPATPKIDLPSKSCVDWANGVVAAITAQAANLSASLLSTPPTIACTTTYAKVCGSFASEADGAKLQPFLYDLLSQWLQAALGPSKTCPDYLNGYTLRAIVAGDGNDTANLPPSCLEGESVVACSLEPCVTCAYLSVRATPSALFPIDLPSQCKTWTDYVVSEVVDEAARVGAKMLDVPPSVSCQSDFVKVCGTFASEADGAKLQPWLTSRAEHWLNIVTGSTSSDKCLVYMWGVNVTVTVGGDDNSSPLSPPDSCLKAAVSRTCTRTVPPFPKCECNRKPRATPFAALPLLEKLPGRRSTTSLYCFTISTLIPSNASSICGSTTELLKAEFYADDNRRRNITSIGVQANGAAKMSFRAPSWGPVGDQTLKATSLYWDKREAEGGRICLELYNSVDLGEFCMTGTGSNTCWINFFDATRVCCPLYAAVLV